MKKLILLSSLFSLAAMAAPSSITLGVDSADYLQHTIVDQGPTVLLHLGRKTDALKQAFSHVPYPLDIFEVRIPKEFCQGLTDCKTTGKAVKVLERTIVNMQANFPADVEFHLTHNAAAHSYQLDVTFVGDWGTRSISLPYTEAQVAISAADGSALPDLE